jgi:hypothetical protein
MDSERGEGVMREAIRTAICPPSTPTNQTVPKAPSGAKVPLPANRLFSSMPAVSLLPVCLLAVDWVVVVNFE